MEQLQQYKDWTCTSLLQEGIISTRNLVVLITLVMLQPILYPVIFWLLDHSKEIIFLGFMLGCLKIVLWMSYESGFFNISNFRKFYSVVFLHRALRLFWTFIAPFIPVLVLSSLLVSEALATIHF